MNQVNYLLEQVWLAHQEMGLGPLVQAELLIIAILVACWLVERVVRLAVRIARRRTARALSLMEKVMESRLKTHADSPHRRPASIFACIAAFVSVAMLPSRALAQSGDMNCDGAVNIGDIPLFVDALLATGSFGGCDINRANMNADGQINGRDVQAFVAALLAPACPGTLTLCFGTCRDLQNDPTFCGTTCENATVCSVFETCTGGVCVPVEQ